jgi:hypothetical protein
MNAIYGQEAIEVGVDANTARSVRPADRVWRGPTGLALERFLLGELVYLVRGWVADGHVDPWL